MRTSLELFHDIRVATPCTANWDEMAGTDQVRFCGGCQMNVFNLSEMTAEDAIALIRENEGHLCTRFYRRADGTILTADCRNGASLRRGRAGLLAASVAGLLALNGCTPPAENHTQQEPRPNAQEVLIDPRLNQPDRECIMGGLAPPKELLERELIAPPVEPAIPAPPALPATDTLPLPRVAGG